MKKKEILKVYKFRYCATLYGSPYDEKYGTLVSTRELKKNDTVVVEKLHVGVFIGKIEEDVSDNDRFKVCDEKEKLIQHVGYKYLKKVDISDFMEEQEKRIRKQELQKLMEKKFAELDKEMKYKFYAENNDEMKELYEEYINL